jgi:hypothetical protein
MKTKTKTIQYFTAPSGLVFTDKAGFVETLFTPINGKTAFGYFTRHKSAKHGTRAIKLHRGNGEVFAVIVSNGRFASLKSLSMRDGKEWALAAATSADEKLLGFDGLSYVEEINLCVGLVESMNPEKGKVDA